LNTVLQFPPTSPAGSAAALEQIRGLVRADLQGVDAAIRSGLKSIVPLVDQVAEHIIGGGGKRLRPLLVVLAGRPAAGAAQPVCRLPPSSSLSILPRSSMMMWWTCPRCVAAGYGQ